MWGTVVKIRGFIVSMWVHPNNFNIDYDQETDNPKDTSSSSESEGML